MEFHVAQLLREATGSRREYEVKDQCTAENGTEVTVEGVVQLLRTDAGILASADLATVLDITCSRCLQPAGFGIHLAIEEEYYPSVDVTTAAPVPIPDESTPFVIDDHHILGLCEAVRQQLILAEPMQPLCREECAGLCATCGMDRNAGPCRCSELQIDARWAALSNLTRITEE
jgi:uncharacterized protein